MATEGKPWRPDWGVPPGEILLEALEDRQMTQSELARRMDRPIKTINEIVNGKAAITPDTAIQLERTLGISASFWNQLETLYREHLARQREERDLESMADWARRFPVRDLERCGLVEARSTRGGTVAELLKFFRVGSVSAWEKKWLSPQASFRRSPTFISSPESTAAWLRWGEIEADRKETLPFDMAKLRAALREIRRVTREINFGRAVSRARELLAEAGVALVLTPEFKGSRVSGAAYWLSPDKAVIQLSMRYRSSDQFWFSLFHEAGHLLERTRGQYVDAEVGGQVSDPAERQADQFARDSLIAPDVYSTFVRAGMFTEESVAEFARRQGIAPGIVVGRLQREDLLPASHLNHMKKSIQWREVA